MKPLRKVCLEGVFAVLAAFCFAACQHGGPTARIEANPVLFRSLSAEQQLMVQQGRICRGMSKDAVFLAWGKPSADSVKGEKDGKAYERWVYTYSRPVPVDTFGGVYCGHYRHHRYGPYGGVDVAYVPEVSASVTFENGKVTEWERRNAGAAY